VLNERALAVILDVVLKPGDALYVPAGFPHATATADADSLHLTFGFLPCSNFGLSVDSLRVAARGPRAAYDPLDDPPPLPLPPRPMQPRLPLPPPPRHCPMWPPRPGPVFPRPMPVPLAQPPRGMPPIGLAPQLLPFPRPPALPTRAAAVAPPRPAAAPAPAAPRKRRYCPTPADKAAAKAKREARRNDKRKIDRREKRARR